MLPCPYSQLLLQMKSSPDARLLDCIVVALVVIAFAIGGGAAHAHTGRPVAPPPAEPAPLAKQIDRAQAVIEDPGSSPGKLADAGLTEELSTEVLASDRPGRRRATLALLSPRAAATERTDLAASAGLSRITTPEMHFPPWRISQPPPPGILLADFRAAQARFGVPWQYLAAIEFVETRFGRIHGPSPAGAQGPMQFEPSTWAAYGRGSIDSQHDAIFAAARYLVANGAPRDMADALFHYNDSPEYGEAVTDYARRMQVDARAFDGYYNWQVIVAKGRGKFLLPDGYPSGRPEPIR